MYGRVSWTHSCQSWKDEIIEIERTNVTEDDQSRDTSWLLRDLQNLIKLKQIGFSGKLEIIQRNYPDCYKILKEIQSDKSFKKQGFQCMYCNNIVIWRSPNASFNGPNQTSLNNIISTFLLSQTFVRSVSHYYSSAINLETWRVAFSVLPQYADSTFKQKICKLLKLYSTF